MQSILAMAHLTLYEARRRRIVTAAVVCAAATRPTVSQCSLPCCCPLTPLSGEIDSGVMQTVASKPIRRADVVIGKWLGHALIVMGYVLVLRWA
jgi:hypothetical protein